MARGSEYSIQQTKHQASVTTQNEKEKKKGWDLRKINHEGSREIYTARNFLIYILVNPLRLSLSDKLHGLGILFKWPKGETKCKRLNLTHMIALSFFTASTYQAHYCSTTQWVNKFTLLSVCRLVPNFPRIFCISMIAIT
jgi:hypothetical protein